MTYDDIDLHVMSLCGESMMSSIDVAHHMTCLDMQLAIVAFNSELTTVRHAQASHSCMGMDGVYMCKKKWFLKIRYPSKTRYLPLTDRYAGIRPVTCMP